MGERWNFGWHWDDEQERIHQRLCDFYTTNNPWWSISCNLATDESASIMVDFSSDDIRHADIWISK